jgi:NitT/TauT family transport system substrate-binding protein
MITHLSGLTRDLSARTGHRHTRRNLLVNSGRATLIGVAFAAGLGRVRAAGAATQVTIGLASAPCQAPTYAAAAQGFFQDEGLDAKVTVFGTNGGGGDVLAAISRGDADAGMVIITNIVPPRLTPGRALGDVVLTAPLQRGCISLLVPANSEVQSLEDLRGQKVAGSKYWYGTALAEAGIDPDEIAWSASPTPADIFATLQSGEFAAVQSGDGQGALLEAVGAARMIAMNNMPPQENNYCCACTMNASAVTSDRSKAGAITRALMRGSAWAEAHRSETAEIMRPSMTLPSLREITQEDMEAALAMQAFVPMAEAARPILVAEFDQYVKYGLSVDTPMTAATLVNRIFFPVTGELQAA